MKFNNDDQKWNFKQFAMINRTAGFVYNAVQGGNDLNFYNCQKEYDEGRFGWVKEVRSFDEAIEIYDYYTGNEGRDIIAECEESFGAELGILEYSDIVELERQLADEGIN